MKKTIIAGNWKMNKNLAEAKDFFAQINGKIKNSPLTSSQCILCTPSLYLVEAADYKIAPHLLFGGEDISAHDNGAYTGELSAEMLASADCDYCIVGHSERREYHSETNELLNQKLFRLQEKNITPIYCIGESLEQRESGDTEEVLQTQLEESLKDFNATKGLVIAYEPIWAIGTGKAATAEMAQEVHAFIRNWLSARYSDVIAQQIPILYGGSMKPENIAELIGQTDIDGGLIGGAALKIDSYWKMVEIAEEKGKKC